MPAPPKPERRQPKARKPIKRSWIKRTGEALRRQAIEMVRANPIARTKRPARVRQTPRGRDKKSLQALFSRVIRKRDPECVIGRCGIPSRQRPTASFRRSEHACHLLAKGAYPSIEFCTENAVGGCAPCHRHMTDHPTLWLAWVIGWLGPSGYAELVERSRKVKPETRAEIRARLEAML